MVKMKTLLEKLSIKHSYYCHTNNYDSIEAGEEYNTMTDFIEEYKDADIDMNLIFRWDIYKEDDGSYRAEIFIIKQRKGLFSPCIIESINEDEAIEFEKIAKKHFNYLLKIWKPIAKI